MKKFNYVLLMAALFCLFGCETRQETTMPESKYTSVSRQTSLRTLILDGEEYTESRPGDFVSWKCRDYFDGSNTLVEVGRFYFPEDYKESEEYQGMNDEEKRAMTKLLQMFGFVLYDGSNSGEIAAYTRAGLNHRWDWGNYVFTVKPDGTGLYYDFSTAKDGVKEKADGLYKCTK